MDLFVTCFWGSDPLRLKLFNEFCSRYPNVIVLRGPDNCTDFIDYKMINKYLRGRSFRSFTLIDSDLILPDDFFEKFSEKWNKMPNIPCFLTIKNNYQLINGKIYFGSSSKVYSKKEGHTGYVLSFNKQFIDNYTFDESFIYGGYDFFLTLAIMGKYMEQFKDRIVPKTFYDYVDLDVIHCFHGQSKRTPWELYN